MTLNLNFLLRVEYGEGSKAISFAPHLTVDEMKSVIGLKYKIPEDAFEELKVFAPKLGLYLNPDKKISDYDFLEEDLVQLRSPKRVLRVTLQDGSQRSFQVDDSSPVDSHIQVIGEKLKIRHFKVAAHRNSKEYCLRKEGEERWLNGDKTLDEQGMTKEDNYEFGKVFYVYDYSVTKDDEAELSLIYEQVTEGR